MRLRTAVVAGALALGGVTLAVGPANAASTTLCTGELGAVTVTGHISVPAGQTCTLTGTNVTGNATVGTNASLFVLTGTIKGRVNLGKGSYLDATSLTAGSVEALSSLGMRLGQSRIAGSVRSSGSTFDGSIFTDGTTIGGRVESTAPGEVLLESSSVALSVTGLRTRYTHLLRTPVGGDVTVIGNSEGSVVCESKVEGDGTFLDNGGVVQLGVGEVFSCAGQNEWGDDLKVSYNTAALTVTNNLVHGDLCGYRNNPAPTGSENVVEGSTSGQFANLQPTPVPAG